MAAAPHLTVRSTLHRIDGEWQRRDPKTEKSRRTIPLPPVTVEALERQRERQREALDVRLGPVADVRGRRDRLRGRPAAVRDGAGGTAVPEDARAGSVSRDTAVAPVVPIAAARNRLVFTTDKGYPHHGPNLPKELHKATDRLGLPRVTIHSLRHSCAAILLEQGVELIAVSRLLGHTSIRITADIYADHMPKLQVGAMEKMQEAMSG